MNTKLILLSLALTLMANTPAETLPPTFEHLQILMRSAEFDGFNISAGTYLSNSHVKANDRGDVAIALKGIGFSNTRGYWRYSATTGKGEVVYRAPDERLVSDPALDEMGNIVFSQYDFGINDGILKLDNLGNVTTLLKSSEIARNFSFSNAVLTNGGELIFKAKGDEGDQALITYKDGKYTELLVDGQGPSFVFGPQTHLNGTTALKIRMGEYGDWSEELPDYIVTYRQGEGIKKLLADDGVLASAFNNNLGVNKHGDVAVIANLGSEGRLIRTNRGVGEVIANTTSDDIRDFETFAPAINDHGHVAFRAIDKRGKRSLYYYNGKTLTKLLSEGDMVPTDRETGRIEARKGWPGFSSGVTLTNNNELYFHCQLWNKSLENSLGAAIYRLNLNYLNN